MASGIEVAGLALAALPLLVNQIDTYVLGLEKISRLRRYRREFAHYSTLLGAQHAILLSTLENALRGVVQDKTTVSRLICNPNDDGWKDPALQERLRIKLGRSYEPFLGIMASLFDLVHRVAAKMGLSIPDLKITSQFKATTWWRYLFRESVYKDLLGKLDETNAILKTMVEQTNSSERSENSPCAWDALLPSYKTTRKHAEELFKGIFEETCWTCGCITHHYVHFQLQSNPLNVVNGRVKAPEPSRFRILFSNTEGAAGSWKCRELEFERWPIEQSHTAPAIQDFCSSLRINPTEIKTEKANGMLSCEPHSTAQYAMYATERPGFQPALPDKSLQQLLSHLSRRERIRIAAALACGVIQLCGSWMKPRWSSSDIHLAVDNYDDTLLGCILLTWSLSESVSSNGRKSMFNASTIRRDVLVPLGRALVELSVGTSMRAHHALKSEDEDEEVAKFDTALKLVETALYESGSNYADAVRGCLFWSDRGSLCADDDSFQERVFDTIVSPLLRDLVHFENISV